MAISFKMSPEWFDRTDLGTCFDVFNQISDMKEEAMNSVEGNKKEKKKRRPATPQEYWANALPMTRKEV